MFDNYDGKDNFYFEPLNSLIDLGRLPHGMIWV